jgi:DNA-binding MarR family transcriptional regulator
MTRAKSDLARHAWRLMFDYLTATSPTRTETLARRNLTANDARGLWSLRESEPRPIGTLAREWGCDPSNATFIIDRLVRAGLVERRESDTDRRVKQVRLTTEGARVKREILDEYHAPPDEVAALPKADLELLIRILGKLVPPAPVRPESGD